MKRRNNLKGRVVPYLMIGPVQLMLLLVILLPIIYTLWLSLNSYTYGRKMTFAGFSNYAALFSDRNFIGDLINNIIFVNIVVYGELFLGLGMAVFFVGRVPFKKLMISIVMAPYAVSAVLGVLMWRFILEPDIGMLNRLMISLKVPQFLWTVDPVHAFIVVILLAIWLQVPFTFLILYNSILGISTELFEVAEVDGANKWQVFRHITVPIIMPAILVALMFRYIFAFRTFDIVWIMTGGGPLRSTELLSIYLYRTGFRYFELGKAAGVAWIMVIVSLLIGAYYIRIMYRRMHIE
ncbi:MAG TPA: sugar ABC transporter permease [Spirochaetia bacterium]|nr:sugar ABC transporter permease [Spirochaetia bacterium]